MLDTDILSEIIKRKERQVLAKGRQYLAEHQRFAFSAITAYEVLRGLRFKRATRQLAGFLNTVRTSYVFPVGMPVLMRAAELWASACAAGQPHDDADVIIAATALEHARVLVSGNTSHFAWTPGLRLEDWRQP